MKTPSDWPLDSSTRSGVDGNLQGREVSINTTVLEFVLGINLPSTLAGNAKGGVVHNKEEATARGEMPGGIF